MLNWPKYILSMLIMLLIVMSLLSMLSFGSTEANTSVMQTVTFGETDRYIPNPYMGPVAFAKSRYPNFEGTIVIGGFTWAEIETKKGQYDFTLTEEINNYDYWVNQKNRQYMVGLSLDHPSLSRTIGYDQITIPMWLYEELKAEATQTYAQLLTQAQADGDQSKITEYSNALDRIENDRQVIADFNRSMALTADIPGVGTYYRWRMDLPGGGVEYRGGFSPNYASPLLIDYHDKVMQAIAKRYDNKKTYAVIMGSLGHWGEMHTYYIQDAYAAGRYPGSDIASQYEQAYARYFQNTIVSSRNPRKVARDNNFGLHNHGFGDPLQTYDWFLDRYTNGYQCYFTKDYHPAMPDFWKTAPSGAEFLYTGDYRFLTNSYIEATLKQAEDTYLTWLLELWYDMSPEAEQNMERLMAKIGYRFAITEASFNSSVAAGENIELTTKWRNSGTAPFYYDWPIVVQLKTAEGTVVAETVVSESVRSLFPGTLETYRSLLEIPVTLSPGLYQLWIGIFNPETRQAAIKLAVDNMTESDQMVYIEEIIVNAHNAKIDKGDITGNGKINIADVVLITRYCLGLTTLTETQLINADVNSDGVVDVRDIILILQYALGLIDKFPES